jgi:DNA-binding MarR family transcriptional regulator
VTTGTPRSTDDDVSLLPVFRALVECHTTAGRVSARYIEATGLTPAQFDVIVTLGETAGMTCSELGRRTLITKGTLTPVLDRLEAKGLLVRRRGEEDARQIIVVLTEEGEATFQRVFYPHVEKMKAHLDRMAPARQAQLVELLHELQATFE